MSSPARIYCTERAPADRSSALSLAQSVQHNCALCCSHTMHTIMCERQSAHCKCTLHTSYCYSNPLFSLSYRTITTISCYSNPTPLFQRVEQERKIQHQLLQQQREEAGWSGLFVCLFVCFLSVCLSIC